MAFFFLFLEQSFNAKLFWKVLCISALIERVLAGVGQDIKEILKFYNNELRL